MLKISIIIPVYNTGEYLRECFDSIIAQTYGNFEVVVVDDGSTDHSGAICDEYATKDSRFVVIHKQNGGVSAARNTGIDAATGDYIGFADSDDTILPGMFEEYVRVAKTTEADLIEAVGFLNDGEKANNSEDAHIYEFNNDEARREFFTIGKIRPSVCLAFIKKELVGYVRFPTNIYQWEDYAFIAVMVSRTTKTAVTANRYYQYRYREGSATKRPMNDRHLTCLLIDEFLQQQGIYKEEQERHDVVGFFIRCVCKEYIASDSIVRKQYRIVVLNKIRNNFMSIRKCRAVPLMTKLFICIIPLSDSLVIALYRMKIKLEKFLKRKF